MQRKRFDTMTCPIARSLEHVGEWWSMLILRDAFAGLTRFDEFEQSLGIAPNMLSRRLSALVEAGMLERRRYSERPPRDEYVLTERGRDFRGVLLSLVAYGNRHFSPEGPRVMLVDAVSGAPADPVLVDRVSGRLLGGPEFKLVSTRRLDQALTEDAEADRSETGAEHVEDDRLGHGDVQEGQGGDHGEG